MPVDTELRERKDELKNTLSLTLHHAGRHAIEYEFHSLLDVLLAGEPSDDKAIAGWLAGGQQFLRARILTTGRESYEALFGFGEEL